MLFLNLSDKIFLVLLSLRPYSYYVCVFVSICAYITLKNLTFMKVNMCEKNLFCYCEKKWRGAPIIEVKKLCSKVFKVPGGVITKCKHLKQNCKIIFNYEESYNGERKKLNSGS